MYESLKNYIGELDGAFSSISIDRKELLSEVASYLIKKLSHSEPVKLNFICTHNSRRSHLAQIWTQVAAHYYEIENIKTFSGGTEATAFNPRAVAALKRAGFEIENPGGVNPLYEINYSDDAPPLVCYSKTFDNPANPTSGFAAIMTCSDADENCPFVPGTEFRVAVTYRDPKESDGTPLETQIYDERCRQIATEMFYMMSLVKN